MESPYAGVGEYALFLPVQACADSFRAYLSVESAQGGSAEILRFADLCLRLIWVYYVTGLASILFLA